MFGRLFLITYISTILILGCAPKTTNTPQTTVTVTPDIGVSPPVPPKAATVMEPPKITITKPARDPFTPLAGKGTVSVMPTIPDGTGPDGGKPTVKAPVVDTPPYRVVGMLLNKNATAIIEGGSASWAVRKGDKVEGWTVITIANNNVVLQKGKEVIKLKTPTGGG